MIQGSITSKKKAGGGFDSSANRKEKELFHFDSMPRGSPESGSAGPGKKGQNVDRRESENPMRSHESTRPAQRGGKLGDCA